MTPIRGLVVGGLLLLCANAGGAAPAQARSDVDSLLLEARALIRQMRISAAEERLRLVWTTGDASAEQDAYARFLLGIVAHERRDADAAERSYREALERSSSTATRAVAQSNLDMLATERARYAAYAPLRTRLDVWLAIECAVALAVACFVVRVSR
ncbi:MAG: hypothetical protein IPH13_07910 [Planctomycetes bacterium]|nr:hypothetical protein [Planctomycetota bacterium]MCC7170669.1 hypothetical protein [Planctomycetota bacterium]